MVYIVIHHIFDINILKLLKNIKKIILLFLKTNTLLKNISYNSLSNGSLFSS